MSIELVELILAYRKLKLFLFQQQERTKVLKLVDFERNLYSNLLDVRERLSRLDDGFVSRCRGALLIPYRVVRKDPRHSEIRVIDTRYEASIEAPAAIVAYSRTIADIPIDCELVFALWMCRVGYRLDACFKDYVFGDRLIPGIKDGRPIESNQLYRNRQCTCDAYVDFASEQIRRCALKNNQIVFIQMEIRDVAAYGRIPRDFVEQILLPLGDSITDEDRQLTALVVKMLKHWYQSDSPFTNRLPYGSCILGLLSNVLLARVDERLLVRDEKPLFYCRHGKSMSMAFTYEPNKDLKKLIRDIKGTIAKVLSCRVTIVDQVEKTRVCIFSKNSAADYLDALEKARKEDNVAWNRLPDAPDDPLSVATMHSPLPAGRGDCALQGLVPLSLSRRRFVKLLNDIDIYLFNLDVASWQPLRIKFLETIRDWYCGIASVFEHYPYFPRILSMAFACSNSPAADEFKLCMEIIRRVRESLDEISSVKFLELGTSNDTKVAELKRRWRLKIFHTFGQRILECGLISVQDESTRYLLLAETARLFPDLFDSKGKELIDLPSYKEIQNRDLADVAFKTVIWEYQCRGRRLSFAEIPMLNKDLLAELEGDAAESFGKMWSAINGGDGETRLERETPMALLFATRGVDQWDMSLAFPEFRNEDRELSRKILSWYHSSDFAMPTWTNGSGGVMQLEIPYSQGKDRFRIGLTSWKTDDRSWVAGACGRKDPLLMDRFKRLSIVVNHVFELPSAKRPHYLLMPELAINPMHFLFFARKLALAGVSFVSGVDYIHQFPSRSAGGLRVVTNEVWGSFCVDNSRARAILVRFVKSRMARDEGKALFSVAHAVCRKGTDNLPLKIIRHGSRGRNIDIGLLICSDVLNIDYRAKLRGKIDLLVVPAWNKDVPTYSSLVDAAAYDVHAFIALVNSRIYGDTRLRSPAKLDYERDVIRVRGGTEDFVVVGEIDVSALRKFQSHYISPDKPFKPTPTGFDQSENRRCLPS